ncbi:cytochrome-c peroxidase [Algibacillus agarilyticus]|uniref:cytochrome-c peroxidase n=1 Tax=Algibacillus agarilyticus TaxID=2234133 RepID=UPI000DD07CB4|nr:cytochrome c peroxidase [Algibacillus agarilyticus]
MKNTLRNTLVTSISLALLAACSNDSSDNNQTDEPTPTQILVKTIETANTSGTSAFALPASDDFSNIPQDPNNLVTAEKVALGQMLYHETGIATAGVHTDLTGTWSCASCHHADAGFKAGVTQGMGEGGSGFGTTGVERILADGFDKASEDPAFVPDVQPFTSPAVLNVAFQEVMLWNGQFGSMEGGIVNTGLADDVLATPGTPKAENVRQLAGIEIQAIAGTAVHRLNMTDNSVLQTNDEYVMMFEAAYPDGSDDVLEDAGKAIAAYERTILANQAPFQLWLNGDETAMTEDEIAGATLFFGKANCVSCHTGPALSSALNATESEMFMAIGFADFDPNNPQVTGTVSDADARGRGGFTGEIADNFKFKIPQLYNLADTNIFGHGASFTSVRDVIAYKNTAVPQKVIPMGALDSRFVPLGLTEEEIDQLTTFLENGLYDPELGRYKPAALPTGACFPVADDQSILDLSC